MILSYLKIRIKEGKAISNAFFDYRVHYILNNIKSNIGKTFLNLIKRHVPKTNKLHKIFNKNTVKVSYSLMSNLGSILSQLIHLKHKHMVVTAGQRSPVHYNV